MELVEVVPNNLPVRLTSFIGREKELAQLQELLSARRLVTLTGAGGVGKTRLALEAAGQLSSDFPDGVRFVSLASLNDPRLIPETVAQALDLPVAPNRPVSALVSSYLQKKMMLLVLDNCEHLVEECARLVEEWLSGCPALKILVTSREALGCSGEVSVPVPSLTLPDPLNNYTGPLILAGYEAVQLFIERARLADPGFKLSEYNSRAVAGVCARLDGIPLALELAAACLRNLPLEQLAARLDDRFRLLTGGNRTALPRQQTLKALVDWSYNLLDSREKVVLRRLAVFAGRWTLEAAETVCASESARPGESEAIEPGGVLEAVALLAAKSMAQLDRESGSYYLLETIRQYARQKLIEAGEAARYSDRHCEWYVKLARQAGPHMKGPRLPEWIAHLKGEVDNFRAALDWSLEQGRAADSLTIISELWLFSQSSLYLHETRRYLEQLYHHSQIEPLPPPLEAQLNNRLGVIYHTFNLYDKAELFHLEAIRLWQELDDNLGLAAGWLDYGWCFLFQLKTDAASRCAEESLKAACAASDRWSTAAALYLKGLARLGHKPMAALDPVQFEALTAVQSSLEIWRELGDISSIQSATYMQARIEIGRGNYEAAKSLLAEVLAFQVKSDNHIGVTVSLVAMAIIAVNAKKQPEGASRAARLVSLVEEYYNRLGLETMPMAVSITEPVKVQARQILGEAAFKREQENGRTLSLADGFALVEEITRPLPQPAVTFPGPAYPGGLTEREVEVLRLVAAGYSNPVIAEKLVLSRRTVEAHLRSIFNKLDVTSRAAAARFAAEHKLV